MTEYVTIDPRDFIRRPFDDCPACGAPEAFGVLAIHGLGYTKRCRECRHDEGRALPPLKKAVIYVDQFALSKMMTSLHPDEKDRLPDAEEWTELFRQLHRLVLLQLAVCPSSVAHEEESRLFRLFEPLRTMYELLSAATSFEDPITVRNRQMYEHIGSWVTGRNPVAWSLRADDVLDGRIDTWHERFTIVVHTDRPEHWVEDIRRERESTHELMAGVFQAWIAEGTESRFDEWRAEECRAWGKMQLTQAENYRRELISGSVGSFPPHAVLTINLLLKRLEMEGVPEDECSDRLVDYLTSGVTLEVPAINLMCSMVAALRRKAVSGQRKPPSRGYITDVKTISTLLPYCDAMFIDKECHAHLTENPLAEMVAAHGTRLFSMTNRSAFIDYLDDLEATVDPAHLQLVAAVYGEGRDKPFETLYTSE